MNASKESIVQPLMSAVTPTSHSATTGQSTCCFIWSFKYSNYKGIILILLWNVIIGMTDGIIQLSVLLLSLQESHHSIRAPSPFKKSIYFIMGTYGMLAVIQMILYPLSGLIADLKFGRYKVVIFSQSLLTLSFIVSAIVSMLDLLGRADSTVRNAFIVLMSASVLVGFACFRSNAVHFGLDQLLDSPSHHLSVFLWCYVWTASIGEMVVRTLTAQAICSGNPRQVLDVIVLILTVFTGVLLLLSGCKRKWFYCEMKTHNPYKLVYKVLKFVAKNKYPLMRSSLTYCDDIVPQRMDFAKQLYGGPFTTEVVEDVKTFLRVILMIFLVSPVFYYSIPGVKMMPLYGLHMGENEPANSRCHLNWVVLESGNLSYMVTVAIIPLYVIFLRSFVQKYFKRILHRLLAGIVVVVMFMWVMTLLYGLAVTYAHHRQLTITCLFTAEYQDNMNFTQTLEFPSESLIPPNVLSGIGSPVFNVAILEFISAQSPHTMKGLLLGIFYSVEGLYTLLGCVAVFPFVYDEVRLQFLDCGFFYYIFNSLLGVGFILVAIIAYKWYKYRQREERPYDHRYVEDYYRKYASRGLEDTDGSILPSSEGEPNSINYGTFQDT